MKDFQTLISADELMQHTSQGNLVLLDCRYYLMDTDRGRREYLQAHIPGAYYMDTGFDLSAPVIRGVTGRHPLPHPEILASTLRSCGVKADSRIVAYDQANGAYAARAWWLLNWLGHPQVAVLDGGFQDWLSKGFPTDNQWPPPQHGDFTANLQHQLTVSMKDVVNNKTNLVDSREYKRYLGETEPIDPIAGHIPGAVCMPFADNVDEKGFWKPRTYFEKKFEDFVSAENTPVFYCGSGITACHNILAYKLGTGRDARLYPGSYSEWINYHPVVVGAEPVVP